MAEQWRIAQPRRVVPAPRPFLAAPPNVACSPRCRQGVVADLAWDMKPGNWTFVVVAENGSSPTEIAIEGELGAAPFRFAAGTVATLGLGAGVAGGLLLLVAVAAGRTRTVEAPTPRSEVPALI
jgi:hypothetical protein